MNTTFWAKRHQDDNRGTPLWEWLPWEVTLDRQRGILGCADGGLLCGFRFEPLDLSGRTETEQRSINRLINTAWRQLPAETGLWSIGRRVPEPPAPPVTWHHPVMAWLDAQRRSVLEAPGVLWGTPLTLWIWHQRESETSQRVREFFIKRTGPSRRTTLEEEIEKFWAMVSSLIAVMQHGVKSLKSMSSDEALTELFARLSPEPHPVKTPTNPRAHLSHLLAQEINYYPGLKPAIGTHTHRQAIRTLSFAEEGMPAESFPGMLLGWYRIPRASEWSTRVMILDRIKAQKSGRSSQFNWGSTRQGFRHMVARIGSREGEETLRNRYAERQTDDADMAVDELLSDQVAHVLLTTTMIARSFDAAEAEQTIEDYAHLLHRQGIMTRLETDNADDAFFGTLPGLPYVDVGTLPINSMNAIDLSPLAKPSQGRMFDAYLQAGPWLRVRTEEANPYAIVNHVRDNGMFKVVGPTRSGKSILAADMVSRWGQYPQARCDLWVLDGTGRCLTLCLNGIYHHVGADGVGLQPYARIGDPIERDWAFGWTVRLLEGARVVMTAEKRLILSGGLKALAEKPKSAWTMSALADLITLAPPGLTVTPPKLTAERKQALELDRREIRETLKQFCQGGMHHGLLDGNQPASYDAWLNTFELRTLLRQPALIEPVTNLLYHERELQFGTDHPTLVIMDDAAVTWACPSMEQQSGDWLVSTAKKGVSLGLFTHSLTQIADSSIGAKILESCPQGFFLPNAEAANEELRPIYQRMGCTGTDIATIAAATPQREVYYLCEEIQERRLFRLDVPDVSLKVFARNREQDHEAIDRILAEHGSEEFAYHWFRHEGEPEHAERVRRTLQAAAD